MQLVLAAGGHVVERDQTLAGGEIQVAVWGQPRKGPSETQSPNAWPDTAASLLQ